MLKITEEISKEFIKDKSTLNTEELKVMLGEVLLQLNYFIEHQLAVAHSIQSKNIVTSQKTINNIILLPIMVKFHLQDKHSHEIHWRISRAIDSLLNVNELDKYTLLTTTLFTAVKEDNRASIFDKLFPSIAKVLPNKVIIIRKRECGPLMKDDPDYPGK